MWLHQEIPREISAIGAVHDVRISGALLPDGSEVVVDVLVVPLEQRGRGVGTSVMTALCTMADQRRLALTLSPSGDFGSDPARLEAFYARFGFARTAGHFHELVREPRAQGRDAGQIRRRAESLRPPP